MLKLEASGIRVGNNVSFAGLWESKVTESGVRWFLSLAPVTFLAGIYFAGLPATHPVFFVFGIICCALFFLAHRLELGEQLRRDLYEEKVWRESIIVENNSIFINPKVGPIQQFELNSVQSYLAEEPNNNVAYKLLRNHRNRDNTISTLTLFGNGNSWFFEFEGITTEQLKQLSVVIPERTEAFLI